MQTVVIKDVDNQIHFFKVSHLVKIEHKGETLDGVETLTICEWCNNFKDIKDTTIKITRDTWLRVQKSLDTL